MSSWLVLASGAAALAVLLALPRPAPRPGRALPAAALAAGVGLVVVALGPGGGLPVGAGVPALVGVTLLGGVLLLVRRRRRRREEAAVQARVRECCELLAAELTAGRPPGAALGTAAEVWPPLHRVATVAALGGDVPTALGELAHRPGAHRLRGVAAAWQVAHRSGDGLALALDRVAHGLRAAETTRAVVASEVASARATARLVAALPLLALAMGSGTAGDPVAFLLGTPLGWGCLALGGACAVAGWWWIEAIADGVARDAR